MPRVVLVETIHGEAMRHHRVEYFPYLLGALRKHGHPAEWWVIGVADDHMHVAGRFVVGLPPARVAQLADALRDGRADVVVFHDRPADPLVRALRERAPQVRICDLTAPGWGRLGERSEAAVLALLEGRAPAAADGDGAAAPDGAALLDLARPRFERRVIADDRTAPAGQPVRLLGATSCPYRRPVRTNPYYRDLDAPFLATYEGCAFCRSDAAVPEDMTTIRTPVLEVLLRQVAAHQADAPEGPFEYLYEDGAVGGRPTAFLEAVLDRGLAASTFVTMTRADTIVANRDRLAAALERMAAVGHRLRLVSIGGENFSDVENERLNKGVTSETLWACVDTLRDLEARFPDTFACPDAGYFSAILFTPWTRPADLRCNIEAARRLGPTWFGRVLGSRLQLHAGAAVTELARADGLLADTFGSAGTVAAKSSPTPGEVDLPWRFADPRTDRIHGVLTRLEPLPVSSTLAPDEEGVVRLRRWRAGLPRRLADDLVALAAAVVDAVEQLGADAAVEDVLAHVAAHAGPPEEDSEGGRADDGGGAAPPDGASAPPPLGPNWLAGVVTALERRVPGRMAGYRLTGAAVRPTDAPPTVALDLSDGTTALRLFVGARPDHERAWLRGARFAITHAVDTPPKGLAEERLANLILRALERYAAAHPSARLPWEPDGGHEPV